MSEIFDIITYTCLGLILARFADLFIMRPIFYLGVIRKERKFKKRVINARKLPVMTLERANKLLGLD